MAEKYPQGWTGHTTTKRFGWLKYCKEKKPPKVQHSFQKGETAVSNATEINYGKSVSKRANN